MFDCLNNDIIEINVSSSLVHVCVSVCVCLCVYACAFIYGFL